MVKIWGILNNEIAKGRSVESRVVDHPYELAINHQIIVLQAYSYMFSLNCHVLILKVFKSGTPTEKSDNEGFEIYEQINRIIMP